MNDLKNCSTCLYFDYVFGNVGLCRVDPPKANSESGLCENGLRGVWPEVVKSDWCGKHELRNVVSSFGWGEIFDE